MSESPLGQLLRAIDQLDLEAAMALAAPEARLLTVDGRRAEGRAATRELLGEFLAALRSSTHQLTAEWHVENVWIAEMQASYELEDRALLGPFRRAFILRDGPAGFVDLHAYGAHERPLTDRPSGEREMRLGGHWIPPL